MKWRVQESFAAMGSPGEPAPPRGDARFGRAEAAPPVADALDARGAAAPIVRADILCVKEEMAQPIGL